MAYNTSLPISPTNPFATNVINPPGNGLTFMANISGGTLSPTFYCTGPSGSYYYWSGTSWVTTTVSVGSGGINLGGCGSAIYSLVGPNVYCYSITTGSTALVTSVNPAPVVADIVPDCDCNFYIFSAGSRLVKYNPAGTMLVTYTLTGLPGPVNGGGYAIVGNNVYCVSSGSMHIGSMGPGSIINFSALSGMPVGGSDWASCAVDINSVPVTSTINVSASSCQAGTIVATSNSPVTYSWSGPGITGPVTTSAVVTNSTGVYTCTVFSSGCGVPPTLSLNVAMANNTCITVVSNTITCANLGSATVTAPGIGPYSYTWMPGGQVGPVANGLSPGTYTITVYDGFFNLTYTASTVFTSLIPLSGNLINSSSITCNGASTGSAAIVNLAGGSGNQSYLWTNGAISYTQASPNTLSAGIWSVTVSDLLTGCSISPVFFISQPPPLSLAMGTSSPSVCVSSSAVISGTASGGSPGYTYSWTAGPSGDTHTVSPLSPGNHIFTLQVRDIYNCTINNMVTLNVVPNPVISVPNVSICPLQTGFLTASGATSYTWNNTFTGNTFAHNPVFSQQYSVTGTALGCNTSTTAFIVVKPVPMISISPGKTVCEGASFALSVFGGTNYSWNGPQGFGSSLQNNTISPVQINQAGVYNVTVTGLNSCTTSASASLVVNPLPILSIAPATSSICLGANSVVLNANGNATLHVWSSSAGLSTTMGASVFASPLSTKIYSLSGALNNCTVLSTATVYVLPPPLPAISLSNGTLCAKGFNGSSNTLTLTATGALNYTISTPGYMSNTNPSGPVSQLNLSAPAITNAVPTVTLYGSNGVCTSSTTSLFTLVPNPTVTLINPKVFICEGNSYTFNGTGANNYTWTGSSGASTVYSTGNSLSVTPDSNLIYSVFGSSLGCNSASQTQTLLVNLLPKINVTSTFVCLGTPAQVAIVGTSGSTYHWQPAMWLNPMGPGLVSVNPPIQQTYTVTASLNTCTSSAMVTVSVMPLPVGSINVLKNKFCINDTIVMKGAGGLTYNWKGPKEFSSSLQIMKLKAYSSDFSGIYTLTITDKNFCKGTSFQNITVFNLPAGALTPFQKNGCEPLCTEFVFLTNPSSASLSSLNWQVNNNSFSGSNFRECFYSSGIYTLQGSFTDTNNCKGSLEEIIRIYPKPVADFNHSPFEPLGGIETVQFVAKPDNAMKFYWEFVERTHTSELKSPEFLFEKAGVYPVALVVENEWGCSDTVVKGIKVATDLAIYIPNAFSPNGDELNEVFKPVMRGVIKFHLEVYNRWGAKIFETSDASVGWDGTYNGKPCKEEEYAWKLILNSQGHLAGPDKVAGKDEHIMTGSVLLMR